MRLFIPEIGTVLFLASEWTFKIINEHRNAGLAKLLNNPNASNYYAPFGTRENDEIGGNGYYGHRGQVPIDPGFHTLPVGTSLEVDRIYIRKGNEEFSSVTFKMRVGARFVRFFVKLDDVNRMEI